MHLTSQTEQSNLHTRLLWCALCTAIDVLLLTASAQVQFGMSVPVTLQILALTWIANERSPQQSMMSVVAYIGCGLIGWNVFASKIIGISALLAPSGGFIMGMPLYVAILTHKPLQKYNNAFALIVLYAFGLTHCYLIKSTLSMLHIGSFLISDIVKLLSYKMMTKKKSTK